jgi:uncharacterized protein YqjF (DUF2071 family)
LFHLRLDHGAQRRLLQVRQLRHDERLRLARSGRAPIVTRFLTAEWRDLAMLNFAIDPAILTPLVPRGTELDSWRGTTYISLVGFRFLRTALLSVPIPFHRDFEEVNLRFYVRRLEGPELRRGVVFIRELVPRWAIAAVARAWYNEPYTALPMRHRIESRGDPAVQSKAATASQRAKPDAGSAAPDIVHYGWRRAGAWEGFSLRASGEATPVEPGSEAEYITEHYWGYTRQRDGGSIEYRVEHPRWRAWPATPLDLSGNFAALYSPAFAEVLSRSPTSAFIADGSPVTVYQPRRLPD